MNGRHRFVLGALPWILAAAAAMAQAQEIVIGQTISLTGPSATIAQELRRGRQLCTDYINAQGGVRGQQLRLLTRDDQGDPERAVRLARELVEREGAGVLFGSMGPAVNTAVLSWARADRMPVIGPFGGDIENRTSNAETAYFLTANQSAEAERLANHISSLGLTRVVIVHGTDQAGRAALTALEEGLGVTNVAATALIKVDPNGSDAATAAQAVAKAQVQAVLLATTGRATIAVLRALRATTAQGSNLVQVYGMSSAASHLDLLELGSQARGFAMSQVVPLPRDTRFPLVQAFQAALRMAPGARTHAELEGCMAPLLLAEVLKKTSPPYSRSAMTQALRSAGQINLGGLEVDLADRTRPGSRFTDLVYVGADGRMTR